MRTFHNVDEIIAAKGDDLGYSDWLLIDQERVNAFADATGDHQFIHVDPERAAKTPFGGTIAHGYLTLSLLPVLSDELYAFDGFTMGVNYGANKLRFLAPVKVGSRIRLGSQVLDVVPGGAGVQMVLKMTVEIEGSDKPALIAEVIYLMVP